MDRLQSLRLTVALDDPELLGVRCSTMRSSLGEDLDSFFPKFDESINQEAHDRSDLFFDDGAATDVKAKVDQLQRMLAVDKFNTSKDHHHHQKLAKEFCLENLTKTMDEDLFVDKFNTFNAEQLKRMMAPLKNSLNFIDVTIPLEEETKLFGNTTSVTKNMGEDTLFVDKFNTFNAEQLKRMLAPLQNSLNFSDVTIPLQEETKQFGNSTSVTDSPTLPYNSFHENTAASDGHSDVEATIQYELSETKHNVENDDTLNSKKRKLSTVIENLAKKIKFDHR